MSLPVCTVSMADGLDEIRVPDRNQVFILAIPQSGLADVLVVACFDHHPVYCLCTLYFAKTMKDI